MIPIFLKAGGEMTFKGIITISRMMSLIPIRFQGISMGLQ